jgi:hypothetical protein
MTSSREQDGMFDAVDLKFTKTSYFPENFFKYSLYIRFFIPEMRFQVGNLTALVLVGIPEGPVQVGQVHIRCVFNRYQKSKIINRMTHNGSTT